LRKLNIAAHHEDLVMENPGFVALLTLCHIMTYVKEKYFCRKVLVWHTTCTRFACKQTNEWVREDETSGRQAEKDFGKEVQMGNGT